MLLAAYHDGLIKLVYKDVQSYNFNTPANSTTGMRNGHGDWLIDEVRLSENGLVLHEILFSTGVRWLIESADVTYHWEPMI